MLEKTEQIVATPRNLEHLWSRKDFFSLSGLAIVLSVIAGSLLAFLRFMFPRVLFEPKSTFKAGFPNEYPVGTVNEKFMAAQKIWVVRTEEGFYALSAVCTHLGCTARWLEAEDKFKCPCHGSGFYRDGINFEGPAPRALERVKISLTEDGQLLVDKGVTYLYEKGEWGRSLLKV